MKELKDVAGYVSPKRLKGLSFFRRSGRGYTGLTQKLYSAIVDGKVDTDHEASELLFGMASSPRYYKVKHELRSQLENTVLLIDGGQRSRGSYYDGFIEVRKQLCIAEVLWIEGRVKAAVSIFKKALKKAIELEFSELIVPILYYLRNFYVTYRPDVKKYQKFQDLLDKWTKIREAEVSINSVYFKQIIRFTEPSLSTDDVYDIAEADLAIHLEKYGQVDTIIHQYLYYFVRVIQQQSIQQYLDAIQLCWESIDVLKSRSFTPRAYIRLFLLQIISCTLRFEGFQEGRKAVIEYLKIVTEGDQPWFRGYQLYLYLCIQSREFDTAVSVSNRIFAHPKFKRLRGSLQERWYLVRAYLSWLIEAGIAQPETEKMDSFRLGRFLNNVPTFSKDKKGMNIPVLIIQSLWLVQQKKYGLARDRFDSLERYAGRHLRAAPGFQRTYYFVKLLCQLPKADFHRGGFERRASRWYKKMIEFPRPEDQQSFEVEIIPYEQFFADILGVLDNKLH